jgi:hypothetical protein
LIWSIDYTKVLREPFKLFNRCAEIVRPSSEVEGFKPYSEPLSSVIVSLSCRQAVAQRLFPVVAL